jgi:hypothetical protein
MEPVDLVATQISEVEQRREDAWAVLKKMHDQANGIVEFTAAGGWCAPTSVIYDNINININDKIPIYSNDWRPGIYPGTYVRDITP